MTLVKVRRLSMRFHVRLAAGLVAMIVAGMAAMAAGPEAGAGADEKIVVVPLHQSAVITSPWVAKRVSVTDPKVADIQTLTPQQVLVMGKSIGSTDVLMWNDKEEVIRTRIDVNLDMPRITTELKKLFPKSKLELTQSQDVLMVTGYMTRTEDAQSLHKYLNTSGMKYVDMTTLVGVQQVLLRVKVAEVSRTAIRALGINSFINQSDFLGGITVGSSSGGPLNPIGVTIPPSSPGLGGSLGISPAVTIFGGFPDQHLFFFLQALAENQYLRILAEPNLVALSGEEATFLAGGEIPIPVVQGGGSLTGVSITIEYKEFGVRLKFRPTVLGDNSIRLHVAPEVSQLTANGAVVMSGFSVPALVTRRAETTLELKSGQSFAMAGLINRADNAVNSRIPAVGDVPILGSLFRSTRYQADDTEMVVMVTATLVEPITACDQPPVPGSEHLIPNDWEFYALGRIEGKMPAKLSPVDSAWLRQTGLCRIKGPGAWESCGQAPARSQANIRSQGQGCCCQPPPPPAKRMTPATKPCSV